MYCTRQHTHPTPYLVLVAATVGLVVVIGRLIVVGRLLVVGRLVVVGAGHRREQGGTRGHGPCPQP